MSVTLIAVSGVAVWTLLSAVLISVFRAAGGIVAAVILFPIYLFLVLRCVS